MKIIRFCARWRGWIHCCLESSSISVLVNGSPTEEFKVSKGLRQGDPMAPFLFLIVAEGLSGLMRSVVQKNLFKGYKVGGVEYTEISHLQYAGDSLLLGEAIMENARVLKCIMRCFELSSVLKANYHKSCLIGIKVREDSIDEISRLVNCKIGCVPFKYLGIPVGTNPRRISTWNPIIDLMLGRLSRWRSKHLSFGGHITLINSVLSSLPMYFLSFVKAPKAIVNHLVSI